MRLGIYIPVIEDRPGGLGTYTREITRRLADRLSHVTVYTATPESVPKKWPVDVVGMPDQKKLRSFSRGVRRSVWLNTSVPRLLRSQRIDAFFSPVQEGIWRCPIPQAIVVHDLTNLRFPSAYFSKSQTAYMRLLFPKILRSASRVIAVSENTRRDLVTLIGLNSSKISVIPEGFATETFFPRDSETVQTLRMRLGLHKPYILYSGTYAAHKNTDFLADVLKAARALGVDVELALTGRLDVGGFSQTFRRIESLGIASSTHVLGYLETDQLATLMRGALAFVFPSLYEGFGLAPLEAMACGTVVIASNRASLPEVIGDAGFLTDPTDPEAWAETIRRIHTHFDRRDLEKLSLERAALFSWDRAADQICNDLELFCGEVK